MAQNARITWSQIYTEGDVDRTYAGEVTIGTDGTGYDWKWFGDTASAYMLWDQSADDLKLVGAAGLTVAGTVDFDGTTNLDIVDIDGALQIDGATTFGVDGTSVDVKFFGDTASAYMLWDESADDLVFAGAAGINITKDKLLIGGTPVTTTADELNLLDNVSGLVQADFTKLAALDSTAAELNIVDGGTSATGTTLATTDRVVVNDNGTMVQVAMSDFETFMESNLDSLSSVVTVGALDAGSITSGFTSIDVGAGAITTTGVISGGTGSTFSSSSASEPVVHITNTHAGATSGELRFNKDSASGADSDVMGMISFYGTDDSDNTHERLAYMDAYIVEADHASEAAGLRFFVAENDATLTQGLSIVGQAADNGEVDVTIGAGAASTCTIAGNLTITGTTTTVNVEVIESANGVIFEGATADGYETTLKAVDPTGADKTHQLANVSGYLIPFAVVSTTAITSTPAELNILDGVTSTAAELNIVDGDTSATGTTLVAADRVPVNDNGTMVQVAMSDFETFMESNLDTLNGVTSASALATVGTITAGVWNSSTVVASAYLDADTAHLSTAQTFSGAKSFSAAAKFGTAAASGQDVYMYTAGTAAHVGLQWDANGNTEGMLIGGADDHGVDLKFFGESASKYLHWNMATDELILATSAKLSFHDSAGGENILASADGHLEVNAGTTLDITAPTVDINAATSIQLDSPIVDFEDDAVVLQFGANDDVTLTHVHDTGLTLGGAGTATNLQITNSAGDGDAAIQFALSGTVAYTMGVEDGDSDKFVINVGAGALGAGPALEISAAGTTTVNSFKLNTGATCTAILDEDAMGTNSDTALATQQSIKAFVASSVSSGASTASSLKALTNPGMGVIGWAHFSGSNFSAADTVDIGSSRFTAHASTQNTSRTFAVGANIAAGVAALARAINEESSGSYYAKITNYSSNYILLILGRSTGASPVGCADSCTPTVTWSQVSSADALAAGETAATKKVARIDYTFTTEDNSILAASSSASIPVGVAFTSTANAVDLSGFQLQDSSGRIITMGGGGLLSAQRIETYSGSSAYVYHVITFNEYYDLGTLTNCRLTGEIRY